MNGCAQATDPASMTHRLARLCALTLAVALVLSPAPCRAIAPLLLVMLKQLAQDAAKVGSLMPGRALDPEKMAAMARMQQAMSQPCRRARRWRASTR